MSNQKSSTVYIYGNSEQYLTSVDKFSLPKYYYKVIQNEVNGRLTLAELPLVNDEEFVQIRNPKLKVYAKPNCRFCLGSGHSIALYAGGESICSCVTEQLSIGVYRKDYSIPNTKRLNPGAPEFFSAEDSKETP